MFQEVVQMTTTASFEDPLSELHHALRATRRRDVVRTVSNSDVSSISVRALAREIAANEHSVPTNQATGEPYRNVYNALSQTHLPTLAAAGIIIYDPKRQTVSAGQNLAVASLIVEMTHPAVTLLYDQLNEDPEGSTMTD